MFLLDSDKDTEDVHIRKVRKEDYDNPSRKMLESGINFIEESYEIEEIEVGVIYGSVARNEAAEGSDIDMLFVCDDVESYPKIADPLNEIVESFEYEMSPHLVRKKDLKEWKLVNYPPYFMKDEEDKNKFLEYYKNKV